MPTALRADIGGGFVNDGGGIGGGENPVAAGSGLLLEFVPFSVPIPKDFLVARIARWCLLKAKASCSFVSINVNIVSLSGGGF